MKIKLLVITLLISAGATACTQQATNKTTPALTKAATSVTPAPPSTPADPSSKNGDYKGAGTVTKINMELISVEMDHDDIPNLMPAMRMEFFVTEKKMLDGIKVGDRVDFVVRYKDGSETITKLTKAK